MYKRQELLSRTKLRNLSVTKTTFYPPSFVRIGSLSTTDLDDLILTPDLFERLDLIYGRFEHSRSFPFFLQDRYLIDTSTPVLSETIDSLWTDNGNFVKNESYAYDSIYLKPISIVQTTSDGEMLEIKNEYVFSDAYKNEDPYKGMIKNNIVSPIIERQEYKKKFENVLLSTQKLSYKQFYPKVFKPSEFMISFESNPFYLKSKYSRHDSHGNPLCITSDDLTTIYLWGYSYQYPVAEIKNASWEQVESIIGDAEAFAAAEIPDGMLLARLRTELPSAQVTVYTYEPLVGITSSTDPRGHTTYYEYDDAGRLVRVKEGEKTTTLYKYHYRNEENDETDKEKCYEYTCFIMYGRYCCCTSFVGNRIDSRQQPAGSRGGIRQMAGRVPRTGQGRNEMPVGFPRNANPFGGTSRGIFYSGQFPYGYSLWSRGA